MRTASMNPSGPGTSRRVPARKRRNCPIALAVFAIAYVGLLVVIFAPKGTFVSHPTVVQATR